MDTNNIPPEILQLLGEKLSGEFKGLLIPPPVFKAMRGEFDSFDIDQGEMRCKFPVLPDQLNPFGHMQGGVISAAIDNTIGPLSMLVAKPNVTRRMELKYTKPVTTEVGEIFVTARFTDQKKHMLFFEAIVENSEGDQFVSAKSTHWILR